MNEELILCAQMNFENFEKACPWIKTNPYYVIAKSQLDESVDSKPRNLPEPGQPYNKDRIEP